LFVSGFDQNTNFLTGSYQVTPVTRNGLNWNFYPQNGVMLLAQYGWNPEFFKPPACADEKTSKTTEHTSCHLPKITGPSDLLFWR